MSSSVERRADEAALQAVLGDGAGAAGGPREERCSYVPIDSEEGMRIGHDRTVPADRYDSSECADGPVSGHAPDGPASGRAPDGAAPASREDASAQGRESQEAVLSRPAAGGALPWRGYAYSGCGSTTISEAAGGR
jgi:hypothetical protein